MLSGKTAPQEGAVWFSHHGSFRVRPELLLGGNLGGIPQPIAAATGADPDASVLSWASMRLRYEPTVHIGRSLSIHLGIDAFDNLLLGQTHTNAGGPFTLGLTNDSAAPPSPGVTGIADSLEVRSLFGRWDFADFMRIEVGRMPRHFGLGVTRNAGDCDDCDFGSIVDLMRAGFTVGGFRLEASWEWAALGATTEHPSEPFGQPKDLGQDDDVSTYTIQLGQRPVTAAEIAARHTALHDKREWVFDWAIFSSFTDQELSSLAQANDASLECQPDAILADGSALVSTDCIELYRRNIFLWRPGVFFEAQYRPDFDTYIRIGFEGQALVGELRHPQRLSEPDDQEAKDVVGFGAALELEYTVGLLTAGFDGGFATGDNGDFLGVLDGQNIVEPDDDLYETNTNVRNNRTVTSFWFNRDYRVDLILFRQVIGTVTNAVYLKPWVRYELMEIAGGTLSARFDAMYAIATKPTGTPGNGQHWGVELDAQLDFMTDTGLGANLTIGVLLPMDALDDPDTPGSPDPIMAIQANLLWKF